MDSHQKPSPSTIIGAVLCVVFIPIILVNLILIIHTYTNPNEMPGVFGIKPAIVLSGSMEPTIQVGDLIFLHKTDPATLQEGDVVCYLTADKAVTHRIVSVTTGEDGGLRFVTQGDANNAADRLAVTADQIEGVWNGGRIGGLGNFILFMQTTTGMIIFIVCPLLLFILWDIWRRRRLDRAEASRTAALEAELAALKSSQTPEESAREEQKK